MSKKSRERRAIRENIYDEFSRNEYHELCDLFDVEEYPNKFYMSDICGRSVSTISEHITNIYEEKELEQEGTLRKFGNSENSFVKPTNYYNLDVIISVGYRVKSLRGTRFRQWATDKNQGILRYRFLPDGG